MSPSPTRSGPDGGTPRGARGGHRERLLRLATHFALNASPWDGNSVLAALEAAALAWGASRVGLWRVEADGSAFEVGAWPPGPVEPKRRLPSRVAAALQASSGTRWLSVPATPAGRGGDGHRWASAVWHDRRLLGAVTRDGPPGPDSHTAGLWEVALTEALAVAMTGAGGAPLDEPDRSAPAEIPPDQASARTEPSPEADGRGQWVGEFGRGVVVRWGADGRVSRANEETLRALGLAVFRPWADEVLGAQATALARDLLADPGGLGAVTTGTLPGGHRIQWTHVLAGAAEEGAGAIVSVGHPLTPTTRAARHVEGAWAAVRAIAARAIDAEERVRREVGSELHDVAAQHLTAALLRLQLLATDEEGSRCATSLRATTQELEAGIRALRSASRSMAAHTVHTRGLAPALVELADRLTRWHGIPCEFEAYGAPVPLAPDAALAAFRSVAELLANVARHAGAERCQVALRWQAKGALVEVIDDGVGLGESVSGPSSARSRAAQSAEAGLGLFTVRARLRQVGGGLQLGASPVGGTRAAVFVPRSRGTQSDVL